jgi:hypothetical protein
MCLALDVVNLVYFISKNGEKIDHFSKANPSTCLLNLFNKYPNTPASKN